MDRILSVETIIKLETPKPRQGRMTEGISFIFFGRSFRTVCLPVKNFRIQTALTAWLITVAVAAPLTPMSKPNIRIGSSTILITAPITVVSILILAKPWVVINVFMPITDKTNTLPKM